MENVGEIIIGLAMLVTFVDLPVGLLVDPNVGSADVGKGSSLVGSMVGMLVGTVVGGRVGGSTGLLVGWFVGLLVCWFVGDRVVGRLVGNDVGDGDG